MEIVPTATGAFIDAPAKLLSVSKDDEGPNEEGAIVMLSSSAGMLMVLSAEDFDVYVDQHASRWLVFFVVVVAWAGLNYASYWRQYVRPMQKFLH